MEGANANRHDSGAQARNVFLFFLLLRRGRARRGEESKGQVEGWMGKRDRAIGQTSSGGRVVLLMWKRKRRRKTKTKTRFGGEREKSRSKEEEEEREKRMKWRMTKGVCHQGRREQKKGAGWGETGLDRERRACCVVGSSWGVDGSWAGLD